METATPYEVAKAVAEHLDPAEWSAEEGETGWEREREASLIGPDEMRIRLRFDRGRVDATGVTPKELHGFPRAYTVIGFSAEKPPAVMAKDIKNRLLPRYRASIAEVRAKKAAADVRAAERQTYVDAAAQLLAPLGEVTTTEKGNIYAGDSSRPVYARVEVDEQHHYEGARPATAEVRVTVRRDLLPRLAAAVADLTDAPPPDSLRGALAAQAAIWAQASADTHVDEVEDSDDVENDTMSEVYGEAASFLRSVVLEHPADDFRDRWRNESMAHRRHLRELAEAVGIDLLARTADGRVGVPRDPARLYLGAEGTDRLTAEIRDRIRAMAALGESPGRDPAALSPQTIWLAWHTVDDMVGFETEERRDEYAAAVPGVEAGTLELLNDSAARQFIIDAAAEAAEEDDDCECSGEVVPGALPGFNGRNEIQACNTCNRYRDDEAAAAIAKAVGGEVVEHADDDPNRDPGGTWLTVVKDGEELTAERIREIAEASGDGDPGPCPKCGATTNQSWQNADDDRATCGECFEGYWMTTVDGDE
jgi:hypothetical protein